MTPECKECKKPIKKGDTLIMIHKDCYHQVIENTKEYGIRIGMRVHK